MTIKTKYNIGQEVWFMTMGGRPTTQKIVGIKIIDIKNIFTTYLFQCHGPRLESEVFSTKEELLKSLKQ